MSAGTAPWLGDHARGYDRAAAAGARARSPTEKGRRFHAQSAVRPRPRHPRPAGRDRRPPRRPRHALELRRAEPPGQPPRATRCSRSACGRATAWSGAGRTRPASCAWCTPRARSAPPRCRSTTASRRRRRPTSSTTPTPWWSTPTPSTRALFARIRAGDAEACATCSSTTARAGPGHARRRRARRPRRATRERRRRRPGRRTATAMIYTSGTTGQPKGAVRRAVGDPAQIAAAARAHRLRARRRLPHHRAALSLRAGRLHRRSRIALGNTVVAAAQVRRRGLAAAGRRRYRVTTTFSAPTPIRLVCTPARGGEGALRPLEHAAHDRERGALVVRAQAGLPRRLPARTRSARSTARPSSAWTRSCAPRTSAGSRARAARPLRGSRSRSSTTTATEVDRSRTCPASSSCAARACFTTYHKAQEKFEADTRGDFHTVGDVAYFDEEGFYYICDRKNDMIISGGMNIYPAEIEAALDAAPRRPRDVAVIGIPSDEWGESVHAVVVRAPERALGAEEVSPTPASTSPATRSRARSRSPTSSRATPRARS